MKNYIVKSDSRRPVKFNGELLGESSHLTDEEFASSVKELANIPPYKPATEKIKLSLYRTESGKIVFQEKRFCYSELPEYFNGVRTESKIFDTVDDYIRSTAKKNGDFGCVTVALMDNIISNYPEFEEHWVETID